VRVHALVGRTEEIGAADRLLADPVAEPRALLIEGEPGIGKTALLHHVLTTARQRGYAVLSCRPTRSERELSYAGLVELLAAVDDAVLDGLPAPQARVLRVLLRREEPQAAFDRLSLAVATVGAVRAIASVRPVLLTVDDAQWLDHPTVTALAFVVRRLSGTPTRVSLVRSHGGLSGAPGSDRPRPAPTDVVDWRAELARAMPEGRLDCVRLAPVGASELSQILRRVLGWVPAWPRLIRIAELSAGNPLYALELARAVGAGHSSEDLDGALPDGVVELARTRIARLPGRVRRAVELASVPRAPTLDLLRRLDTTAPDPGQALLAAARTGILAIDGERIRFAHPILAAAVYGSIPAARRRELHRAVALLADDLEERARHLAAASAGPDPQVADALEGAAEQAWRRGAPDAAAELMQLACRLTVPAHVEALALRRIAHGRLLHSAGDAAGAVSALQALVDCRPPGLIRARALYHLMYVTRLSGALGRAVDHGVRAAGEAAEDPLLQAEIFELLSRICDNDVPRKLEYARQALRVLGRAAVPDPDLAFYVRAALVEAEFYAGLGIHLERLEGLDPGTRTRFPPVRTASRGDDLIGRLLAYGGRIDEGLEILLRMYERACVESRSVLPAILGWMAEAQIMAGRFAVAAELTAEAIERAESTGARAGTPWEVGLHAVALTMLGRLDDAEAAAALVVAMVEADPGVGLDASPARLALGLAALSRGRYAIAATHLRQLDAAKRAAGIGDPRLCAHAGDLIEALVALGELAEAGDVLTRFEHEAVTCAAQSSLAIAARCRALVLAATGNLDEALAAAERAVALFDELPLPFERARAVFDLGQLRRRRREKALARRTLTEALQTFEQLGTPVWAERARAALARIPLRQGATGLTPTEEKIAWLAVEGLTNREIADRTFLSPKTVEVNLTRIYRKVGVRSRVSLAGRIPAGPHEPGTAAGPLG
jgi:DNA-binding CsgD family transcriptional regulator